jgi:hypothetical protein
MGTDVDNDIYVIISDVFVIQNVYRCGRYTAGSLGEEQRRLMQTGRWASPRAEKVLPESRILRHCPRTSEMSGVGSSKTRKSRARLVLSRPSNKNDAGGTFFGAGVFLHFGFFGLV